MLCLSVFDLSGVPLMAGEKTPNVYLSTGVEASDLQ
jgi:hypothetical protein